MTAGTGGGERKEFFNKMNIDTQTELFAMRHQLTAMIDQEDDTVTHDHLIEAFDEIGSALDAMNKNANEEFQSNEPPLAPKLPWN